VSVRYDGLTRTSGVHLTGSLCALSESIYTHTHTHTLAATDQHGLICRPVERIGRLLADRLSDYSVRFFLSLVDE